MHFIVQVSLSVQTADRPLRTSKHHYLRHQCRYNGSQPKQSHQVDQECTCASTPSTPLGVPTPEPCDHGYDNTWGQWSEWDVCKIIDERRCDGRTDRPRRQGVESCVLE